MNADKHRRKILGVSLYLNIALMAVLMWMAVAQSRVNPLPVFGSGKILALTQDPLSSIASAAEVGDGGSFHWRQIESTNYETYITNLRRIGCPEQTIRDIIAADLHAIYARKEAIERRDFSREETFALNTLLGDIIGTGRGPTVATRAVAAAADHADRDRDHEADPATHADSSISLPLAYQPVPVGMYLTDQQLAIINEVRQQFQNDLGPTPADRTDPVYRQRWHRAQNNSDDLLAGMLGGEFYLQYQLHASNQTE